MEVLIELDRRIQKLENRLNNLINYGVILSVDYTKSTAIVDFQNGISTPELPFLQAPNTWNPLKVGDQVVVIAFNGIIEQGFIVPKLYKTGEALGTEENTFVLKFAEGEINYKEGVITINSSAKIVLQDESGDGVVCKNHLCAFTGTPHMQGSSKIKGAL
ncbi:phage baseplate assembly protein V [Candidatus Hepatincola sp. Av]